MYIALWVFVGIVLSVPVAAVALLVGLAVARFRTRHEAKRVQRSVALVLGAAPVLALAVHGAGWYLVAFLFPLCLAVGCAAGYVAIERLFAR